MNVNATLTQAEREAIAALADTGEIRRLQAKRLVELAAKRRAVRARLTGLEPIEAEIARSGHLRAAADAEVERCRIALMTAADKARAATLTLWAHEAQRDAMASAVRRELGALADPRCAKVAAWLATLRYLVRGATVVWTEPRPRTFTLRGAFGFEEQHDSVEQVQLTNRDEMNAALATITKLCEAVEALVFESDAEDVGAELARIKASALDAIAPLLAAGDMKPRAIRPSEMPELNIEA